MRMLRTSYSIVVAFFMLLLLTFIVSDSATACPVDFNGSTTFTAAPGDSQTQTWTVNGLFGSNSFTITSGSDVFTVSPVTSISGGAGTFTITFKPGANSSGEFKGTMTCPCNRTVNLVGTVASSGIANAPPTNISLTITPNPATDHFTLVTSGARTSEIAIYNVLGKEIASSKMTNWKFDASSLAPGTYFARVAGESFTGDPFILSRRIIVER